jgi:glycosyltransferase involved in cell wall biosynthesis
MKILHVIAGAKVGGAETFAQDAILSLDARGVRQGVVTRPYEPVMRRYGDAGIPVRPFAFSVPDRLLGRGRAIRADAAAMQVDLVHAWMSRAASFIPAGMPCPVVGWFGDYYNLKYFRRADFHFCVTPDISRYVAQQGGRPHRVVTLNTFGTMPDSAPVARADFDTPEDAPLLLVLSRMHAVKGIDTMLQAMTRLPGAYLWLAGDGPERAAYEALAAKLGLADRVRFLGWRNDRKALLAACDICVLPSRYEPFGTVIVEAWAMRRPLVATMAAGAMHYVVDGVTGLLCPIEDEAALAACLERAIGDEALRRDMAAAGYAAYEADFTRTIVTDRLIDQYERCRRLGTMAQDKTQPVAGLDWGRLSRLIARLRGSPVTDALARSAIEVALAYATTAPPMAPSALRRLTADAALLQAAGLCRMVTGSGWSRRVLMLGRAEMDHAVALFDRSAVDVKYQDFVETLTSRLFGASGGSGPAARAQRFGSG